MNDNPFPANGPIDLFGPGAEVPLGAESDTDGGRMNIQPLRQIVRINNPQGLHMRPAAAFAQMARQFESSVVVWYNERSVNGKSWLDLMLLAALPGADVELEVIGEDALSALPKLAELLAAEGIDDPMAGDFSGL